METYRIEVYVTAASDDQALLYGKLLQSYVSKTMLTHTPEECLVLKPCDRKENEEGWKVINKEPVE